MQERFGGDTAHVQTGAAQGVTTFDTGGFKAQLRAADRGHIATGAAADYDYVIGCHLVSFLILGALPPNPQDIFRQKMNTGGNGE